MIAAPAFPRPQAWLGFVLCFLAVVFPVISGFEEKRVVQILVLVLPGFLLLLYPAAEVPRRLGQALLAGLYFLIFIADGIIRAFLFEVYAAAPNSALVVSAVANSNAVEALEYSRTQAWPLSLSALSALACAGTLAAGLCFWLHHPPAQARISKRRLAFFALCLLLVGAAVASKPWRRHHPVPFWVEWWQDVGRQRDQWAALSDQRDLLLKIARLGAPRLTAAAPSTAVLVITDSVNRDNLALYGYPRDTTPSLSAEMAAAEGRLGIFRHVWSLDAGTIPALRRLFYIGQPDSARPYHLLALARTAGYRVFWIGNHDDLAVEQEHAQLADHVQMLNQTPGRSTSQLDGELLGSLREALTAPGERKLIVLHLLGAHPHYSLRYPDGTPRFADDAVEHELEATGRPFWIRSLRNDYDTALRYHDGIVAETLRLTRMEHPSAVWIYLSDHGQEVGHSRNQAGHSPSTAAGYRIPLLIWRPEPFSADLLSGPVRADWISHSLISLLGIDWQGYLTSQDVLAPAYRWLPPDHPVVRNFME